MDRTHRDNLIGTGWMILAMALFAIEDSFVKAASQTMPIGQVLVVFGFGGAIIYLAVILVRKDTPFPADLFSRTMAVRTVCEVVGRMFFMLALALTPLSSVTVILQATPIVVVLVAVMLFGEKVGLRRWLAILTGLAGVLVILQPTPESFEPLSMLAVLGMLGFAGRDLASRAAPPTLGTHHLGLYGFVSVVIAGLLLSLWYREGFVWPDPDGQVFLAGATGIGVFAYMSLTKAMRTGEVSAVTPFRYTRLVFGIGLGVFAFGETLDTPMILGSLLIVSAGLVILWRQRT